MTEDQRNSESNAIWLCARCHSLVDKDEVAFPAELLFAWKDSAESHARLKMLEPRFGEPRELRTAIAEALQARGRALDALDPRFETQVSVSSDGSEKITIKPLENVGISIIARKKNDDFKRHLEEGRSLKFQGKFQGSKLLEHLSSQGVDFNVATQTNRKTFAVFQEAEKLVILETEVARGIKYLRISSDVLAQLFRIEFLFNLKNPTGHLNIDLFFGKFVGQNICDVGGLEHLNLLYNKIRAGTLSVRPLVNGSFRDIGIDLSVAGEGPADVDLRHILDLAVLSKELGLRQLVVPKAIERDDFINAAVAASILRNEAVQWKETIGQRMCFKGDGDFFLEAKRTNSRIALFVPMQEGELSLKVQGVDISLPEHCIHYRNAVIMKAELIDPHQSHWCVELGPGQGGDYEKIVAVGNNPDLPARILSLQLPR